MQRHTLRHDGTERHRWRAASAAACTRMRCCNEVGVRGTQPAQPASRECSAGYSGKHWQRCSGGNLIQSIYRAQWGSRTSQQACTCLCTCTCTYVVLSCLPSLLSSECEHEGTHNICRVSARHLQDWVLHRLFHGQGLRHARERAFSSEREGRRDGESHVHRRGGDDNTILGWA